MAQKIGRSLTVIALLSLLLGQGVFSAGKEDIKKFPPVAGEIYGQGTAGVKSITVNNKPVTFDVNQNFRARINLRAGEKHLVLRLNFDGLRVIKKYLILRKSPVEKFQVFVPKEKIEKEVRAAGRPEKTGKRKKYLPEKARLKKPKPGAPPLKVVEYLYVWEFSEGKLLMTTETQGGYSAEIYIPAAKEWLELKGLTEKELRELIKEPAKSFKPGKK